MSLSKHNNIQLQRVCVSCHTFQLALNMLIYLFIAVCFQHAHNQLLDVLELVRRILQEHHNTILMFLSKSMNTVNYWTVKFMAVFMNYQK